MSQLKPKQLQLVRASTVTTPSLQTWTGRNGNHQKVFYTLSYPVLDPSGALEDDESPLNYYMTA